MSIAPRNDNAQVNAPKPVDAKYYDNLSPWADPSAVELGIPLSYRYE